MKNCIVFLPSVIYLREWSYAYVNELRRVGYAVTVIDLSNTSSDVFLQRLSDAITSGTHFILSIYAEGSEFQYEGRSLYDYLEIPFIAICIDHLEYYAKKAKMESAYTYWGLFDAFDYDYGVSYISANNKYFFFPNAGYEAQNPKRHFNEREYDVTFVGTLADFEKSAQHWLKYNNPMLTNICESTVELLLSDENLTVREAFEEVTHYCHVLSFNKSSEVIVILFAAISHYVRGLKRELQLKSLASDGVKIHCFGAKEHLEKLAHPNFIKHDFLYTADYLNALGNSKIVINSLPMARMATTERLVSGMLNGAAVATDGNAFVHDYYTNNESMIHYSHNDYGALADQIKHLLARPAQLEEIALNGQAITRAHHSLENRVQTLISTVDFYNITRA